VKCRRARDRWADARDVSVVLMDLESEIRALLDREDLDREEKLERRAMVYEEARERFRTEVQPGLRVSSYDHLAAEPLNNATLLSRTLYFHRLEDFHRLWKEEWSGDLAGLIAWIREEAPRLEDPFDLLL
jgi:predicted aminopeptidase